MASSENIVLTRPDDWEQWLFETRAICDEDIWPHIDPAQPPPARVLETEPAKPSVSNFDRNTQSYAQLSATLQNRFNYARKHYDQDLKYYQRQ
jgi:hypothetical protein